MGFSYDSYGKLKQSKMFLYSSKTKPVGTIVGATNIKLEQNFHKLFELNFRIYKNVNNEETEFYDKIIKNKLIEVQYINWFQILSAVEKYDDTSKETYKEVKCCPLENSLIYRKVHDINGVFALLDYEDQSNSLLHIISAECGWSIGHVSNSLLSKYRTFNIDSMEIYNLMTTQLQDSFGCIFQFDSFSKTINVYLLSELNELTDIVISKKNVLKEYIKDDSEDAIITKMSVNGGDDGNGNQIDIRAVNFGRNYLTNLDYYMTTEWVSQSLVDSYNTYKTASNNARTSFNNTLSTLKTKNSELTILQAALKDLQSLKSAQENIIGASVSLHGRVPISTDSDYTIYQNAITLFNSYLGQIASKESEITVKQSDIATIQTTLDSISNGIDESNYFTSAQIAEMNGFIAEGDDFDDSTYVITSETSEEEALEIKTELMQSASDDLFIKSKPQYTFTIKASSLYTIQDDKDELIPYSEWREQLKIGSLITLFIDSTWTTVRLMSIIIDFDNPEEVEMKFSSKSRLDDELMQLAEIIADSGRASSALSLKQLGYDTASKLVNQTREFINGTLSATLNSFQTNDNQEMLYDQFGLHGRKWLTDQNKYADNQLWVNNNGLLLTSDGWITSATALGLLTLPDGSQRYGLATDVIFGNFILTSALTISNENNTITLNKDGANFVNCDITIQNDTNTIKLSPTNGLQMLKGEILTFYADTDGNLNMTGVINATSGTLGSLIVNGTITGGDFIGSNITGSTISGTSYTTYNGSLLTKITDGAIGTSMISIYSGALSETEFNEASSRTQIIGGNISLFDNTTMTVNISSGGDISCIRINGGTPITTSNISGQTVGYASTAYSANVISGVAMGYNNSFSPMYDASVLCGSMNYRWSAVYAASGTIVTSDRNKKNSFKDFDDRYVAFFDLIKPQLFRFNDGDSGRFHAGFIAQDVEQSMMDCGILDSDFAGFIKEPIYKSKLEDGEPDTTSAILGYNYALRYEEFIPILVEKIKRLEKIINIHINQ